ncbi:hypothetical protein CRM22_000265 [Opisthorchis felineus]|uniref:Uncharacterized protein n=1 Tax=Opisthorchis felineus TaxID=147828 RepID=A0A4S2MM60_OPIFE|nr:hypothetical protein CRM22_000265 [Opisthorchis felineus]
MSYIELVNRITRSVYAYTAAFVEVSVFPGDITIRPIKGSSSVVLASFWIRILQSYFQSIPRIYNEISIRGTRDSKSEYFQFILCDFIISVTMKTGEIKFKGAGAVKFFRDELLYILSCNSTADSAPTLR